MFHHFDKFPLAAGGWRYVAGYGGLTAVALALDVWWLAVPLALLTLLFVGSSAIPPGKPWPVPGWSWPRPTAGW